SLGMMNGEDGRMLQEKYAEAIAQITPMDMLKLEDRQLQMGLKTAVIKKDIEKVINTFFKPLQVYEWEKPLEGSFLYYLMLENKAMEFRLNQIKKVLKSYGKVEAEQFEALRESLKPRFEELTAFEAHYVKKENILFPFLEKKWAYYRPLQVMWSLHDDARRMLKELIALLDDPSASWKDINPKIGKYFFMVFGLIQKEELIVFPVAAETIAAEEFAAMHQQSFEYPFPFIETPKQEIQKDVNPGTGLQSTVKSSIEGLFSTETGTLDFEQIELIFNSLPLDFTFVDENDKVRYFSKPADRFFPRSPAIIGRDVRNCHPPESLDIVERIIEGFRSGERSKADFWINMKGRFILIQYFALRDAEGLYKGVLEISHDATASRALEGEQRLLDWK
ncbi:MAG: PAS domain-containing protein, partial [Bacteroidales bacterium]|nr:PAS domain-containing protein [Bacteroidales bacterium]